MKPKAIPLPEGHHSVNSYLLVEGVPKLLEFLKKGLGAIPKEEAVKPDGSICHAEVRIGDSIVMMGEAGGPWKAMPCTLYLYVNDVDASYRRALQAGGKSLQEPKDQFYGDRSAGIEDPCGNFWWIATHVEDVSEAELQKRFAALNAGVSAAG